MSAWHGIVVATTLPFTDDLRVDYDRFQQHVAWLAANGSHGVCPNGSLGEYQTLTDTERADVVRAAVEAAPEGFHVMPGTGAYGADASRRWAEQAAEAGAHAVLSLPPNSYKADDQEVLAHYREIAKAGLPIVAYNNPFDTNVDLTPELLAQLAEIEQVVAVKEFSGDVRRVHRIKALAPQLDVLAGADDVVVELVLMGAVGWIGGYSNAVPQVCRKLYDLAVAGDVAASIELYRTVHAAFSWDSRTSFVQAIKLSQEVAGRFGGPTRLPRLPLSEEVAAQVRKDMEQALTAVV